MEQLGGGQIRIDSRLVGSISAFRLHFEHSLRPRIGLELGISLIEQGNDRPDTVDPRTVYHVAELRGALRWENQSGKLIEHLSPMGTLAHLHSTTYPQDHQVSVSASLDWHTLEQIEKLRAGGPPTFWFTPFVRVVRDGVEQNAAADAFQVKPSRDAWLDYLRHVGFGRWDVLEVAIPEPAGDSVRDAIAHVSRARRLILEGGFSEAAAETRLCLEALDAAVRQAGHQDLKALAAERVGEDPGKEHGKLLGAAKQLAAGPHHYYGRHWRWARAEALYQVRLAEALVALTGAWLESPA